MKKCPYCAEEIQDEAILCRYCGSKLPGSPLPVINNHIKEPPVLISLLIGFLLLVVTYGIAFFIAWNWTGTNSELESSLAMYQAGVMLLVTLLAVPGINPEKRNFLRYVGIFFLSVIPVAGWIVIYWAGKGIARSLRSPNKKARIAWLTIIMTAITLAIIMFLVNVYPEYEQARQEVETQIAQEATSFSSTQEIEDKIKNCIGFDEAYYNVPFRRCFVGKIIRIGEVKSGPLPTFGPKITAYFSNDPDVLYLIGGDFLNSYLNDCVVATGQIMWSGTGAPFIRGWENNNSRDLTVESLPDNVCLSRP